jgi:hypothetical protein
MSALAPIRENFSTIIDQTTQLFNDNVEFVEAQAKKLGEVKESINFQRECLEKESLPADDVRKNFELLAPQYQSIIKSQFIAQNILKRLTEVVTHCTRPKISADTYVFIADMGLSANVVSGREKALEYAVTTMNGFKNRISTSVDHFKDRVPTLQGDFNTALSVLKTKEGKGDLADYLDPNKYSVIGGTGYLDEFLKSLALKEEAPFVLPLLSTAPYAMPDPVPPANIQNAIKMLQHPKYLESNGSSAPAASKNGIDPEKELNKIIETNPPIKPPVPIGPPPPKPAALNSSNENGKKKD